jgi:hypothetical protein
MKFNKDYYFYKFQKESNAIEGIMEVKQSQIQALYDFVMLDKITVEDLCKLAKSLQPRKSKKHPNLKPPLLRDKRGRNVSVGNYTPPFGGSHIRNELEVILKSNWDSFKIHVSYEMLHPFTDCNGRTGRAIWLWKRRQELQKTPTLLFLQSFYYQTLESKQGVI